MKSERRPTEANPADASAAQGDKGTKRSPQRPEERPPERPAERPPERPEEGPEDLCPLVGIGASAGGLEAFRELFRHIPARTGLAFVLIQHLDPTRESLLASALASGVSMPVSEIEDGVAIEPDRIYVIGPDCDVAVEGRTLRRLPRPPEAHRPFLPLDFFFESLAAARAHQAIGVVLSGTGSDGTEGLRAIKAHGGITLVQEPQTAKFAGMPQSALDAGVVDEALPLDRLALEIARLSSHPYLAGQEPDTAPPGEDEATRTAVFAHVRRAIGVDFSEYKPATVQRRLTRRMALLHIESLADYFRQLTLRPDEARLLCEDIFIHVTSFFRDPEVFEELKRVVFPALLASKTEGAAIRVWVAGCSTGEEVYSLAIALHEHLGEGRHAWPIQFFGTDISEAAIAGARAGVYSEQAMASVSDERRRRYFSKVERGYRVNAWIRDACVFVRHDLAHDPPFSRLDLVSCRNVLIYFGLALQKRVIATFHYCLSQPGFVVLGGTENVATYPQLFVPAGKTGRIFARTLSRSAVLFPARAGGRASASIVEAVAAASSPWPRFSAEVSQQVDRLLLSKYAPPGVVVNEKLEIIQYRGRTGAWLEPAPGEPQHHLLKMAREGLLAALRSTLAEAQRDGRPVRREAVRVGLAGESRLCDLVVLPITGLSDQRERLFAVLFEARGAEDAAAAAEPGDEADPAESGASREPRIPPAHAAGVEALERELAAMKEYVHTVLEDRAGTNDSLMSLNEELVSSNEELQAMNEELETAKEELQATNEELSTVNDELHARNQEMNQANGDLVNLLNTVDIPVVILDLDRRIRRFTPKARSLLNVLASDVGRPMVDIAPNVRVDDLDRRIAEVIGTVSPAEMEVQDREGRWYRMQIRPYVTTENKIDGAIVSLVDIDALKHHVRDAEWARDYAVAIVQAVQVPLLVLDRRLQAVSANEAYYRLFRATPAETEKRRMVTLGGGAWDVPELRAGLGELVARNAPLAPLELERDFPHLGRRRMVVSARQVRAQMILVTIEDVTEQRRAEAERSQALEATEAARRDAEEANRAKDQLLATVSHELRTPIASTLVQSQLLQRRDVSEDQATRAGAAIERATRGQARLVEDLLDMSRIVNGKLRLSLAEVRLADVARDAVEAVGPTAERKRVALALLVGAEAAGVIGDALRLLQVVSNLLTNAIKFTPEGGRVTVTVDAEDGQARLRVADTGVGIDPAFLPALFNRFAQEEPVRSLSIGGLGLGLSIVRSLVELHHGRVLAESPGHGRGATFTVLLPLASPGRLDAAGAPPSAATPPAPDGTNQ